VSMTALEPARVSPGAAALALPETTETQSWGHPNCGGCPWRPGSKVKRETKGDPLTSYEETM
jgi:hypothetical protein